MAVAARSLCYCHVAATQHFIDNNDVFLLKPYCRCYQHYISLHGFFPRDTVLSGLPLPTTLTVVEKRYPHSLKELVASMLIRYVRDTPNYFALMARRNYLRAHMPISDIFFESVDLDSIIKEFQQPNDRITPFEIHLSSNPHFNGYARRHLHVYTLYSRDFGLQSSVSYERERITVVNHDWPNVVAYTTDATDVVNIVPNVGIW